MAPVRERKKSKFLEGQPRPLREWARQHACEEGKREEFPGALAASLGVPSESENPWFM